MDGKIVGSGYRVVNNNTDFAVFRYDSSGALDSSFGTNGSVTTDFSTANSDNARKVLIQRNGKIIAVGKSGDSNANTALARYNPNGTIDTTFGQNGKVLTNLPQVNNQVLNAAIQTDNKVIVVGNAYNNSGYTATLTRYVTDVPQTAFDFDGDGKTDVSVFRSGVWHLQRSQNGFSAVYWGIASDRIAPADFDGDGKTDATVCRPSNGEWSVLRSSNGTALILLFGASNDVPCPGDFDGDGKADVAVWRPSNGTWYRINSSDGQLVGVQFGANGDVPLLADFDGDGKSDIAVYRPSNGFWYWLRSSDGHFAALQFGIATDKPVPADYDGDGKTDIAVFRPSNGTWYLQQSVAGFAGIQFGLGIDIPVAADYDGDGKTDLAVVRNGIWYLNRTTQGFTGISFGTSTDLPIPNAFAN